MRTRRSDLEHQGAVSRRLAMLGDELAGVRPARPPAPPPPPSPPAQWHDEHTRPVARARPVAAPALVPVPGRHASRRAGRLSGLALGAPQLAVVAVLVAVGLAVTCWWLVRGDARPAPELAAAPAAGLVTPAAAVPSPASASATHPATVTIDVAGKVRRPGIAVLDAGSRVVDALSAAGGARPGVDLTTLNLARPLVDGEQLLVGLPAPTGVAAPAAAGSPGAAAPAPGALVNLNTATEAQLDTLPEVGPVTAASILAWRTDHGTFTSVDELLEVDGGGGAVVGAPGADIGGDPADPPLDLRMPALGAAAWLGAVAGTALSGAALAAVATAVAAVGAAWVAARRSAAAAVAAWVLVALSAGGVAALHVARVATNPVADLAGEGAAVTVVGTVSSDARRVGGGFSEQVAYRLDVHTLAGRGQTYELRAPVLVIDEPDAGPELGAEVELRGRLAKAEGGDTAALLLPRGPPVTRAGPSVWWRGAGAVRQALRDSVAHRPEEQRALVPALVAGDDALVDEQLQAAFRATGLTHLLAVSGTNLTLVVGFLLAAARWARVRGRWLLVVAGLGIVGFVLVARTEPSVLRAAVMGTIGLVAMSSNGRGRALRGLGLAVLVLVLVEPGLAVSAGFALSVLATGGILLLAPRWRDALARWLPRWLAEAVAVPAAAQLACTPLVAAISGQVSLVAVVANLVVAPVVGPATVLGLAGGLTTLVWASLGRVLGTLASWCVAWLVTVAEHGSALPTAAITWGTGPAALLGLTALTVAVALLGPYVVRRPATGLAAAGVLVAAVLVRPPALGWPPEGWVVVACDVGQGDALALAAGPGRAVVVDVGPDVAAVDRCLDRLGVEEIPLLVLTHFHADHVDGLGGALSGRWVGSVETTRLRDPPRAAREVDTETPSAHPAAYGATRTVGPLTLQVLWPLPDSPTAGPGDGSTANEASVVLLVETHGLRLLLTGDLEPEGQAALARLLPGLTVDVLKMPHHGSSHQDEDWLLSLDPDVVLVSVGADNDYGHPAASALDPLAQAGAEVHRTDQEGDLAVLADGAVVSGR